MLQARPLAGTQLLVFAWNSGRHKMPCSTLGFHSFESSASIKPAQGQPWLSCILLLNTSSVIKKVLADAIIVPSWLWTILLSEQ